MLTTVMTGARSNRCSVVARFTPQQMIDMGLLPPPISPADEKEEQLATGDSDAGLAGQANVRTDGSYQEEETERQETPEPIGLIGHFEARALLDRKDIPGSFTGSLDMSMTERDLISTEDGVGECTSNTDFGCGFYGNFVGLTCFLSSYLLDVSSRTVSEDVVVRVIAITQ